MAPTKEICFKLPCLVVYSKQVELVAKSLEQSEELLARNMALAHSGSIGLSSLIKNLLI